MNGQTALAKSIYAISVASVCITFMVYDHSIMAGFATTSFLLVALDWG